MSRETCYVLEDGSIAHPRDVAPDANGILRTSDGRAVAMRGDVPRSRSVEITDKDMKPAPSQGFGYMTRDLAGGSPLDHDRDGAPGGSLPAGDRGLDALREEARAAGVTVDNRWGEKRLREEIEKAKAAE